MNFDSGLLAILPGSATRTARAGKLALLTFLLAACSGDPTGTPPASRVEPATGQLDPPAGEAHAEQPAAGREELEGLSERPVRNVLLITIDTLRADYLASYGKKEITTPHIDALAARGVQFNTAVAQVPLTTPSHASILTGTYPQVHNIRDIGGFILDSQLPTLASILQAAGYETAAFVSAAVLNRSFGLDKGFDTYNDDMADSKVDDKLPGVVAEVRGDVVTQRAMDWLQNREQSDGTHSTKPFLLWVHYYDPHFPYDPPQPYRTRYASDPYAGEVAYTDEQIGRLLNFFTRQALLDKTLIILLSDHGESLGEHGEHTHGVFLYDSTVHIPLIVAGPGVPEGRVVEQQVRSIDVMPTIVDYFGLPAGSRVQGVSLMPAIAEGKRVRTHYSYMETLYPKSQMGWSELRAMRTDEWKFIIAPTPELYNLKADQDETENMVDRYRAQAKRLQEQVWKIDGPAQSRGEIESQPLDEKTLKQLQALGYVRAGTPRQLRFDVSGPDPKDRVHVLEGLDRATGLMNDDHFAAAVPVLEGLIQQDPTNPLIYQHLGTCLQENRQFEKAREVYLQAIKNEADTDRTHAELGEIYVRFGQLNQAVESMRQASRLNLSNLDNLSNLANAYMQLGRLDDAEGAVKAILTQRETHAMAHNLLGVIEIHRGRHNSARQSFEKAIKNDPDLVDAYMNLGLLAQQANQQEAAIRYYRIFLEKATDVQYREIVPKVKAAIRELESDS